MERLKSSETNISWKAALIERFTPTVEPRIIADAAIEDDVATVKNQKLDPNDWRAATDAYYTVWKDMEDRPQSERVLGAVSLSQMLINMGCYGQARRVLDEVTSSLGLYIGLQEEELRISKAKIQEKYGWLADYEGDFETAYKHFSTLRELTAAKLNPQEEGLYSTATHFSGRALVGIALSIREKSIREKKRRHEYLNRALEFFSEDLQIHLSSREKGNPKPAGEAFQWCWIARCHIHQGLSENARYAIDKAENLFREGKSENSLGHIYNLYGTLQIMEGKPKEARKSFEEGLAKWLEFRSFPKGLTDSMMGIAASYWGEGNIGAALVYTINAIKTNPAILYRGRI